MDTIAALRRQLADHERAAAELREILAGMEGPDFAPGGREASALNGAGVAAELLEQCRLRGFPIMDGYLVRERHAAALLGLSPHTLKGWRLDDTRPPRLPFVTMSGATHYDVHELAEHLRQR